MTALALLLITATAATGGCHGIRVDAIDGLVTKVTTRHDAYVRADPDLSAGDAAAHLSESALLHDLLENAPTAGFFGFGESRRVAGADIAPLIDSIGDRHDAYVAHDDALSPLLRDVYLHSTKILRRLVAADGG